MADTSRFDKNITLVANRLHDPRTMAVADPNETSFRYSLTVLQGYQNQALRDAIREAYTKYGDRFDTIMPEMTSESGNLAMTSGIFSLPADAWIVLECAKSDYSWYAWRIKKNNMKVKAGRDGVIVPTVSKPAFYQTGLTVVVLPTSITNTNVHIWYIQQPSDITAGSGAVIPINSVWDGEIRDRMVAMGLMDAKSSVAI